MAKLLTLVLRTMAVVAVVPPLAVVLTLFGCQSRIIYHPRPATLADLQAQLPRPAEPIRYHTDEGDQVALWLPPVGSGPPGTVWLMCGGNGSLSTDYGDLARRFPDPRAGFLFCDYPGYGVNPGSPSPSAIKAATIAAMDTLVAPWGWDAAERQRRTAVFGHSLGAAAALQYAAATPVGVVVLVAPFTSTLDMARRMVGWPLCQILTHRFDNRARLAEVLAQQPPVRVVILHGSDDEVIPVAMGRELAAQGGDRVVWHELPSEDHNGIIGSQRTVIVRVMADH